MPLILKKFSMDCSIALFDYIYLKQYGLSTDVTQLHVKLTSFLPFNCVPFISKNTTLKQIQIKSKN